MELKPIHVAGVHSASSSSGLAVEASHLSRRFGEVTALQDVSFAIRSGEYFSLLGPSGCGKTTFLRIVAGLDSPDAGTLMIAGKEALSIPANRRPVNTVFQSYALFPHMTVRENIAFGLKMKKVSHGEIVTRVKRVMDLVQIGGLEARKPHQLSGGQKQRVALARALVNEPTVLLLDEPLGALDVKLRRELQEELHALQRRLGVTFVHVTHDQDEALGLSDRIAVMDHGRVAQAGTPAEIYERPQSRFVAEFVGGCNVFAATPAAEGKVNAPFGPLTLNTQLPATAARLMVAIRPERLKVGAAAETQNRFSGTTVDTTYTGPETHVMFDVCGTLLKAVVINASGANRFVPGEQVPVSLPADALLLVG